jgi:hypothetical protein
MRANPIAAAAGNDNTTLTATAVNPGYSCLNAACPVAADKGSYEISTSQTGLIARPLNEPLREPDR